MNTQKNILIAFLLNLFFSIFEFFGGIITGSIAIISDSLHDMGDALSIGISFFLEKKSRQKANNKFTYGYIRFSVLGGLITNSILLAGSVIVIYGAIMRLFSPVAIDYEKMILFAVVGVMLNSVAAFVTKDGNSINQKSVNLHMLEDVLGWIAVLVGAIVMKFTDIPVLDPLLSIGISIFILVNAVKNMIEILNLFLEKTPDGVDIDELKAKLLKIDGVDDVHHIHVRSIDGFNNYATMHIVSKSDNIKSIKDAIRDELKHFHISHSVIETEDEICGNTECAPPTNEPHHHHHKH